MRKTSKLPRYVQNAVAIFAMHCPMCGSEAQDRRYKKRRMDAFTLTNRRFTNRTMTRECRVCGLRFSFTWRTFINSLRRKAGLSRREEEKIIMLDRASHIEGWLKSADFPLLE